MRRLRSDLYYSKKLPEKYNQKFDHFDVSSKRLLTSRRSVFVRTVIPTVVLIVFFQILLFVFYINAAACSSVSLFIALANSISILWLK